ncbi:hypothetical protein ROD_35201 [Citrobacter rodentium ICC168]|uniref:Uncharacterized protein n=1 Tax=Citrobacter rodentium (strain ICC168) TaxID=637910 RepID=D2TQU7_CITRI|nr:hypothetical protein ROD_35201 [Citrobacter rodentium ICC168]
MSLFIPLVYAWLIIRSVSELCYGGIIRTTFINPAKQSCQGYVGKCGYKIKKIPFNRQARA